MVGTVNILNELRTALHSSPSRTHSALLQLRRHDHFDRDAFVRRHVRQERGHAWATPRDPQNTTVVNEGERRARCIASCETRTGSRSHVTPRLRKHSINIVDPHLRG